MASGTTSPKIAAVLRLPTGWIDSITDRFFLLSSHPYLGRARDDDFGAGSRSFPVGEHVIVYCVEDDDVLILRVAQSSKVPSAPNPGRSPPAAEKSREFRDGSEPLPSPWPVLPFRR